MKVDPVLIANLLKGLSAVAAFTPVPQLQQVLNYAAILVQLGDEAMTRRKILLERVQTWVQENRGPTAAELEAFQIQRNALDDELAALEATLKEDTP